MSTEDVLRTGANKEAFRSLVGRLALPDGEPAIVGRYDGLKIEGVMSLGNNQLLLGSDDEALGCGARDGDVDACRDAVARADAPRHGDGAIDAYCGGGAARQEGCPNHLSESLSFERLHGAWMLPLRARAQFSSRF